MSLSVSVNNLFFYIQDPSDVGAITKVTSESVFYSFALDTVNNNNKLWFVGISSDSELDSIIWSTGTYTNDGYGLDDFTTVTPVPEPATMLLLGTGLVGLAGFRRRLKK